MINEITGYLSTVDQVTGEVILSVPGAAGATGATGPQGPAGANGSDASVTSTNITAALGFTPDNPTATRTPSSHTHPLSQITQSAATSGQVATWNGTAWIPSTPAAAVVTSVAGKTGAVTLASSDITGLQTALDGKQIAGSYATAAQGAKADSALQPGTAISNVLGLQTALDGKQAIGTYATLVGGTVPSSQLPSYVDDVLEFATLAVFPSTGETGKIYVSTGSNKTYRWSGSAYVEIAASPGSTDAVTEGSTNLYFTATRAVSALASTLSSYATQAWVTAQSYATTSGVSSSISSAISVLGLGTASTKAIADFAPASGISPTAITGTAITKSQAIAFSIAL